MGSWLHPFIGRRQAALRRRQPDLGGRTWEVTVRASTAELQRVRHVGEAGELVEVSGPLFDDVRVDGFAASA